jgi:hypothetical protein
MCLKNLLYPMFPKCLMFPPFRLWLMYPKYPKNPLCLKFP